MRSTDSIGPRRLAAAGRRASAFAAACVLVASCAVPVGPRPGDRPRNVLLICVDDLRPQLRVYGERFMVTPNLDRVAAGGRAFTRHYVQVPTCGASRCSMLTGRYPRRAAELGNDAFRRVFGDLRGVDAPLGAHHGDDVDPVSRATVVAPPSLPGWFRRHGYRTLGVGKISHQPGGRFDPDGSGPEPAVLELPDAWDGFATPVGAWGTPTNAFFGYADGTTRERGVSPPVEIADVDVRGYADGLIADAAIQHLRAADGKKPFFLAVGFFKPHLPFTAPRRYRDYYDGELPGAVRVPSVERPADAPDVAFHGSGELLNNYGGHDEPGRVTPAEAERLRLAYFACCSYVDAQIGRVLAALEDRGLADDTVVVVWGDHGWHLGELGLWGKHTLFEMALRSTLIVRAPGQRAAGRASDALVESADLFPTLTALCGIPTPDGLDGVDASAAVLDPRAEPRAAARSFWRRGRTRGASIRTDRWRLTRWTRGSDVVAVELYDHDASFDVGANVAAEHPDVVADLSRLLDEAGS